MKFKIEVKRTSYVEYEISAGNQEVAEEIALDRAESEHGNWADYEVTGMSEEAEL